MFLLQTTDGGKIKHTQVRQEKILKNLWALVEILPKVLRHKFRQLFLVEKVEMP
jgi:hypothetical protein